MFRAVEENVFLGAKEELLGTESEDKVLDRTFLAALEALVLTAVLAAVVEVRRVRVGLVFLGWITAGTSPVFVLTMGPRLILKLTSFTGPDLVAFELLLNLLSGFVKAVHEALEEVLTEDCNPVLGCFLTWLTAYRLDFEVTLYVFVSTRF